MFESSLLKGLKYYGMAIDKFLGNSLITRIMKSEFSDIDQLRAALVPDADYGEGTWLDVSGMIAPEKAVNDVLDDIQNGILTDVNDINSRFVSIHSNYYDYEWNWAYQVIEDYYGVDLKNISADKLIELIGRWKNSVITLDNLVYEDARKDFSINSLPDSDFESNPFVRSIQDHIHVKSQLYDTVMSVLSNI